MSGDVPSLGADKEGPDPVDTHVGNRVKLRRNLLGLSQEKLGEALKLTFQQVQKYERGVNRISASRLYGLSRVLDVPISFFFDDLPDQVSGVYGTGQLTRAAGGFAERQDAFGGDDALNSRETMELVRAYYRIRDPGIRKKVADLIKGMAQPEA